MVTVDYAGQVVAFATQHHKDRAVAPVFRDRLGVTIEVADVDTDAFGTFAGDVPRTKSPLDTALAKVEAGLDASTRRLALASEGTIGPDSALPLTTSDIEVLVFRDAEAGITIHAQHRSYEIVAARTQAKPTDDLREFLVRADFPRHGLIVKPPTGSPGPITKGIVDEIELGRAIRRVCELRGASGSAIIESDLRAHFSPSRMSNITECARQLADRIATPCPQCASPGWGPVAPARGLPCSNCRTHIPTAVRADVSGCVRCPAVREYPREDQSVDPRWCPVCNP